jgi:DNA-binding beta-propeller fold protein YncE
VVSDYGNASVQGNTLTVVDVKALAVAKTIELGEYHRPHGIAFMPDGKRVVVTAEANASVIVVDVESGMVQGAVSTGQKVGHMLALAPDGGRVWVANLVSATVSPIDLVEMTAGEPVAVVSGCEGIAVTQDGSEVWTASREQNVVLVLDAKDMSRKAELAAPGLPFRLAPTADGKTMVVANAEAGVLQLFDVATKQATTVDIKGADGSSAGPVGTIVAGDSKTAFVALGMEDRIAIVDLDARSVVGRVAAGRGADGIGYSDVFVAN